MRLLPAGTAHYVWLKFLTSLSAGMALSVLKLSGNIRAIVSLHRRREVEGYYIRLAAMAREAGFEGRLTKAMPAQLAREYFVQRAIMGVAPILATTAKASFLERFAYGMQGLEIFLKSARQGKGLLTLATHFGGLGVNTALLHRNGLSTVILRDGQFKRFEDTPHGRAFFLGADAIFIDRDDPASTTRALLKCAAALKDGKVVGYTADATHGSFTDEGVLFGKTIPVRTALVRLVIRTKSPVAFAFSYYADGSIRDLVSNPCEIKTSDELDVFLTSFFAAWQKLMVDFPEAISWSKSDRYLIGMP